MVEGGFLLVDPVLSWLAAAMGAVSQTGKDAATILGAGELGGILIDGANASGLPGLVLGALALLAKPAIVLMWGIGMAILVGLPLVARKLGQSRSDYRD